MRVLLMILVLGLLPLPVEAGGVGGGAMPLAVVRISDYLNNLRQFTARFVQVTDKGGYASGRLYIQRPGRMRVDYDLPNHLQIIADGSNVIFYDPSFNSVNSMPLDEFPAGVLLGHAIDLGGNVFVFLLSRRRKTCWWSQCMTQRHQAALRCVYFSRITRCVSSNGA